MDLIVVAARDLSLWQRRRTRLHSPQLLLPFPTFQQRLYSRSMTAACKKIGVMIRALTNFLFYRKGRRFHDAFQYQICLFQLFLELPFKFQLWKFSFYFPISLGFQGGELCWIFLKMKPFEQSLA